MLTAICVLTATTVKTLNPTNLSMTTLALSMVTAMLVFKESMTSWLPFVIILTFSSGMMTLFIYASTLTPNQKTKKKGSNLLLLMPTILILMSVTPTPTKQTKTSMKMFSSQTLLISMTAILIITILSISTHSFNPNQSMISTF